MPTFFPSDVFHLFGCNIPSLIWEILIDPHEGDPFSLSEDQQEQFGEVILGAGRDLPTIFSSAPPRDPGTNAKAHYKMLEWSLVIYLYLVPFLVSIAAPLPVIDMIMHLETAVRIATSDGGCNSTELHDMQGHFKAFVSAWETLYIRGEPSLLYRATISVHHLLHVWYFIYCHGSVQITSQARCEREVGLVKRSLRSHKSPFVGMMNNVLQREHLRIINILLDDRQEVEEQDEARARTFRLETIIRDDRHRPLTEDEQEDEGQAIQQYQQLGLIPTPCPPLIRRGKLVLPARVGTRQASVRGSRIESDRSRKACRFSAMTPEGLIYGEALHFVCTDGQDRDGEVQHGRHVFDGRHVFVIMRKLEIVDDGGGIVRGTWADNVGLMRAESIRALVGVVEMGGLIYIIRKLAWLGGDDE
ncbi:hypothetical protein A4X06_0g8826 [Tilletia controversa]|uniref:Uncharacterized protein n=1 Tax=Tilletia controversa TaxID=13291 RepID=A0A8X7MJL6_9BASI|nr:hypothetical protein CF328_g8053 [Tilletia controversa]KAE8238360.1 hypothetical protein A4X06_0g8826 [Tilletia controversa]